MTLKLRLMDYTLEDEGYLVIESGDPRKIVTAAADYICQCNNQCSELMSEQWDPKYSKWIFITPVTEAINKQIDNIRAKYRRLIEGAEKNE